MRKWISLIMLAVFLAIPASASAQSQIALGTVSVQLWPEFDQPSMLVIYDFTFSEHTFLPADISVRIPLDSNLIAVAYEQDGKLLNVQFQEPYIDGDWQVVMLRVETNTTYHIEYYAPLTRLEQQREYDFIWPGDYSIEEFHLKLKVPLDTTEVITDPQMTESTPVSDGDTYLEWETKNLEEGQKIPVKITYLKTTDRLSTSGATLQTGVIDENTPGRVSLTNYLPYILGSLGAFLILAGGFYFWQSGQTRTKPRKRRRSLDEHIDDNQVYCYQCGKRAQPEDRFCRTCGTRLRHEK